MENELGRHYLSTISLTQTTRFFHRTGRFSFHFVKRLGEQIETILESIHYETGEMEFEPLSHGPKNLVEALESYLSPEELELVPRAYDLIGDIAVLEIPDELSKHRELIGRVFHEVHEV